MFLPGAAILTLAGRAVFGVLWGTVIVSFTSSIGATLAFLAARFPHHSIKAARLGERFKAIADGIEREGGFFYLVYA